MNTALGLVVAAHPSWIDELSSLVPGSHVAVLANDAMVGIEGRLAGLDLRDTILVLRSGPSVAFVFLFRKPLAEDTVAEQVMATGTGGLNIDACRVNPGAFVPGGGNGKAHNGGRFGARETLGVRPLVQPHTSGRWPPNLVLVHGAGCRNTGTKKIKGPNGPGRGSAGEAERPVPFGKERQGTGCIQFYTDPNDYGMESVSAWECEPGCPVPLLDGQSGELKTNGGTVTTAMASIGFHGGSGSSREVRANKGGASRFFPHLASEDELLAWVTRLISS